jgi:hypothetical protein
MQGASQNAITPSVRDAWQGLGYLTRNQALRGLATSVSTMNVAAGLLIVGLPMLVLDRLRENAAVVGLLWGLRACANSVSERLERLG